MEDYPPSLLDCLDVIGTRSVECWFGNLCVRLLNPCSCCSECCSLFLFENCPYTCTLYAFLSTDEIGHVVVGVSSHVITERESSIAPGDQLADAQHCITSKKPNNFTFTYDVSKLNTLVP